MPGYTLSSLIPEPFIITDRDGTRYEGRMADQFGAIEYARFDRLYAQFQQAWPVVSGTAAGDKEQAAALLEQIAAALVETIVPAMPDERRRSLTFSERFGIIQAWFAEQPTAPKATAGASSIRPPRSPASS